MSLRHPIAPLTSPALSVRGRIASTQTRSISCAGAVGAGRQQQAEVDVVDGLVGEHRAQCRVEAREIFGGDRRELRLGRGRGRTPDDRVELVVREGDLAFAYRSGTVRRGARRTRRLSSCVRARSSSSALTWSTAILVIVLNTNGASGSSSRLTLTVSTHFHVPSAPW